MKAACVLLCLTLAHGITASIFRPQQRQVEELDVSQQQYIRNQQSQEQLLQSNTPYNQQQLQNQEQWDQPQLNQQQINQAQQPMQRVRSTYHMPGNQQNQEPENRRVQNEYSQSQEQDVSAHSHKRHHHRHHHNQYETSESQEDRYNVNVRPTQQQQYPLRYQQKYVQGQQKYQQQQQAQTQQQAHQQLLMPLDGTVMTDDNAIYPEPTTIMEVFLSQPMSGPTVQVQNQEQIQKIFSDAQKAMHQIPKEEQAKYHEQYETASQTSEEAELNATQLAQKHEYPIEEHTVKTDDGYVLTLFRIPPQKYIREVQKRPVVFLMHGILGSADDWLLMGPGKSLAYLLSDAGYDVWLGNARGNKYSRRHVSKNPAVSDFWQYSTDEIALHDLPAMIDYTLKITQQEKLFYIGHSQGTTTFFALTSTRPEYNDKIIMMYALSPMVYMSNVRSPLFRMIAPISQSQQLEQRFGNGAFQPSKEQIMALGGNMLENVIGCKEVSSNMNFVLAGVNVENMEPRMIATVMKHSPAGTSTRVIKQYAQNVASQEFRRYDYGPQINQQVYGSQQPPQYQVNNVRAPVSLYYSETDWLAQPEDVARLESELPNVSESYKVPQEYFSNTDFQFSTQAPEVVYSKLIESMEKQQ